MWALILWELCVGVVLDVDQVSLLQEGCWVLSQKGSEVGGGEEGV